MLKNRSIDNSTTTRVVAVLKCILENPDLHTKKSLSGQFNVSVDTIKYYFEAIKRAGFKLVCSGYPDYTYSIDFQIKRK